jgi:hexokinase
VLHGDKTFDLRQQKYKVSEQLKTGEATVLFNYLADSVDAFLTDSATTPTATPSGIPSSLSSPALSSSSLDTDPPAIHLGLTFSFPVEQSALDSGVLLTWTKGFTAKNAIGNDIVKLLQDAFDRKHMHVKCVALVNDTVGALLSRAYTAGGCILGAIFGTGTNGAYVEDVAKITKLGNSPAAAHGGQMIVNTEWGAFNNSRSTLPSTPFDNKLDRESINPRFQAFEKFISGMYLGEITRNVILALIDAAPKPVLFRGKATEALNKHYGFDTAVMSAVEEAWGASETNTEATESGSLSSPNWELSLSSVQRARLERVRQVLVVKLGFRADSDVSLRDAAIVRRVVAMVADRAAKLSGCAVAATLVQTGRAVLGGGMAPSPRKGEEKKIGVGVDGSLIEFYPNYEASMRKSLRLLVGEEVERRVEIGMAKDGSGVGAALCALQALKQVQMRQNPLKA